MDEFRKSLKDRYHIVYVVFILQGVGILMPFNTFVNANAYFVDYKLAANYSGSKVAKYYQTLFLQNVGFAGMIPLLVFVWINVYIHIKGSISVRVISCLIAEILLLLYTIILAMLDTSKWTPAFFWLTIMTVAMLSIWNGVYQSTVLGVAAKVGPRYIAGIVWGNNISGVLTATIAIIAFLSHPNLQIQGVYYFIVAMVVMMACLDTYLALPLTRFYRINEFLDKTLEMAKRSPETIAIKRPPYWQIYKKAFSQLANVFMVYLVSSALFPAVQANIKPYDSNFFLSSEMFTHITCFFTFNFCACVGSYIASIKQWPPKKFMYIPVLLRFLYVPFYLFSNYQVHGVKRALPLYIRNDWLYWIISATLALTGGYWSSVCLQYIPTCVEVRYAFVAGMFGGAMLISGIFTGVVVAYIWPLFIRLGG